MGVAATRQAFFAARLKRETTDTYNIFTLGACQKLARGGEGGEGSGRGRGRRRGREGKGKWKGTGEGEGEGDFRGGGGDFQ